MFSVNTPTRRDGFCSFLIITSQQLQIQLGESIKILFAGKYCIYYCFLFNQMRVYFFLVTKRHYHFFTFRFNYNISLKKTNRLFLCSQKLNCLKPVKTQKRVVKLNCVQLIHWTKHNKLFTKRQFVRASGKVSSCFLETARE